MVTARAGRAAAERRGRHPRNVRRRPRWLPLRAPRGWCRRRSATLEDGEGDHGGTVDKDEPRSRVEEPEGVEQDVQRDRRGDAGEHLRGEEAAKGGAFADEVEARDGVGSRRGDEHSDDGRDDCDEKRVAELHKEEPVAVADDVVEVFECRVFGKRDDAAGGERAAAERRRQDPQDGVEREGREAHEHGVNRKALCVARERSVHDSALRTTRLRVESQSTPKMSTAYAAA